MTERIGILTSGGDCAGLNAVIRAVVHRAVEGYGWEVVGIHQGTAGLMERPVVAETLDLSIFTGNILRMGGTILGTTNKGNPFHFPTPDGNFEDRSGLVIEGYRSLHLNALIAVGGDGSMEILRGLAQKGDIKLVGIPKTIDNDIGSTEVSIGYASAIAVATDGLDHLQATAASHSRVMVLEVMGRDAGHIALNAGIAGGADVILIPEIPYRFESVAKKIASLKERGRTFALVVVAEALKTEDGKPVKIAHVGGSDTYGGVGHYVGQKISELTGAETRVTVLGHVQRGGMPTPRDRLMASVFGVHAVDLVAQKRFDRMVAWSGRRVIDVPIEQAIASYHQVDPEGDLVHTARGLGISFGDR